MHSKFYISRASLTWILTIALLTAIGSEIKIMPFADTPFRFGLGSIIFFLCTLLRPTPIIFAGITTSIVTTIFRVIINYTLHDVPVVDSLLIHLPAAAFYIMFALCLQILSIHQYREKPLLLGLLVAFSEVFSNLVEQLFRFFYKFLYFFIPS